ncbi:MAG: sugar transferase [Phycisphaerae bacterium]|nr:sugar transferase [Phycisphaerae bacterium]MBM92360.1 sugar transferase [Phycisphaerae bacterium]|tara:strand:- start:50 stop:748 length:699 start_codon:yes stop_codon:yes gene_type:complete
MQQADLIIFDCDGVLVDSEPITNRVLAQCVSAAGWEIDTQYSIEHFKGRNLHEIHREVEDQVGRSVPTLLDDYRRVCYEVFAEEGVPAIEGVHDLLDVLDSMAEQSPEQAPHRCVATNAPLKKMRITLGGSGLIDRFAHRHDPARETMYSAYQIECWKPDPGLFLHAASTMGHRPETCIVIEDSVSGVRAAKAAGMRVIGLAALTPGEALGHAGADRVVGSHHELIDDLRAH